jgi:biopolymer transport protein ExbD
MRIKDPIAEAEEPYNLIPLTDMVFNLLIFFMAATTFAQVERELGMQLPRAKSFATLSAAPSQLVINIDDKGTPVVMKKEYDQRGLTELIAARVKANPESIVLVRADERGLVRGFAAVADACRTAGVKEVKFGYLSGGGPIP